VTAPRDRPMTDLAHPKLFTPVQIGLAALKHRVVMAPVDRREG
jgi:2,4-dienoyl-CoA reductase-like NADH-dependent reductase (Old Yellow Enzyme family)